ncbi:UDP-glucose 4-epimerase GalE [Brevundimonas sp.]|uniref:UDP-glucose 4-epimerase GalE n=1 Tax=Brevundimonas sp. TaxID=1871086 RepID=UPI0026260277|nr:UDP-glucose 4-epimerase GalE [Brevundimonas sp.]
MAVILVGGGAGYIGAHCCLALAEAGHLPVVYDNLSSGHREFVKWGPLEVGDIRDRTRLTDAIRTHRPEAVLHFAGLIEVGASVTDPAGFYEQNVGGSVTLMDVMRTEGVPALVFSSTCAIFGAPRTPLLDETHPTEPLNPYGRTKLMVEEASHDFEAAYGLRHAHLRYFNAAGAAPEHGIGERHDPETHALPLALFAGLGRRATFSVFGDDYDTRDGSCVRDYVHVLDLADAHVAAVEKLLAGSPSFEVNLGTGHGVTVKELVAAVGEAVGQPLPSSVRERRVGDPPALVADNTKAREMLGWSPKRSFRDCVDSALIWHRDVEPTL